jgi:rSAM/selenodomain-associated transferase 2
MINSYVCYSDLHMNAIQANTTISIIIPALNEAAHIGKTLRALAQIRGRGHEIIVIDGGSADDTMAQARDLADHVLQTSVGRARQMIAGAQQARGEVLWFVHADTRVPANADTLLLAALADERVAWGRFDARLAGRHWLLRVVERMMNWRSCLSGIATGDQGIFVSRAVYDAIGGFADIALMEDIELSRRLRRMSRPACVRKAVLTSSRRWEQKGIIRTIVLMWRLRLAYALGADPARLAQRYR